jgi:hypothetical protein
MGSYWFILRVNDGDHEDETILEVEEISVDQEIEDEGNSTALKLGDDFIEFIFAHLPEIIILGICLMIIQGVYTVMTRRQR